MAGATVWPRASCRLQCPGQKVTCLRPGSRQAQQKELQEFESPELGSILPPKPSVSSDSHHPSSVMGALSWGKEGPSSALCSLWGMSCDSLMYPSKRLRNGCNVAIQLAPNPGEEEDRKV